MVQPTFRHTLLCAALTAVLAGGSAYADNHETPDTGEMDVTPVTTDTDIMSPDTGDMDVTPVTTDTDIMTPDTGEMDVTPVITDTDITISPAPVMSNLTPGQMPDSPFHVSEMRAVAVGANVHVMPSLKIPPAHRGLMAFVYAMAVQDDGVMYMKGEGEDNWVPFNSQNAIPTTLTTLGETLDIHIYQGPVPNPFKSVLLYGYIPAEGPDANKIIFGNGMQVTVSETAAELQAMLDNAVYNPPELYILDPRDPTYETILPDPPQIPGAVLGVEIPGEGYWYGAAGVANLETGEPMQPHYKFRIGSMTKTFTGMAILQLVDEGVISLDDSVEQWLPGYLPDSRGEITTVRNLLYHDSGLWDYAFHDDWFVPLMLEEDPRTFDPRDMIAFSFAMTEVFGGYRFDPGTAEENGLLLPSRYSNTNFGLLALIVEAATGKDLYDVYEERFFGPLALENTMVPPTPAMPPESAQGHNNWVQNGFFSAVNEDGSVGGGFDASIGFFAGRDGPSSTASSGPFTTCNGGPCDQDVLFTQYNVDPSFSWGIGNFVSNTADLMKWVKSIAERDLLSYNLERSEFDFSYIDSNNEMGLGIGLLKQDNIGHGGRLVGFEAVMFYNMDCQVPVVGSMNRSLWHYTAEGEERLTGDMLAAPAVEILKKNGHCPVTPAAAMGSMN